MIPPQPATGSSTDARVLTDPEPKAIRPGERLIVALDVKTHDDARRLIADLDNVSFFKIGLQLFLAGDLFGLLERIQSEHDDRAIFIDLKTAGDIQDTITSFVDRAVELGIRFMTFIEARSCSHHAQDSSGRTRRQGRRSISAVHVRPDALGHRVAG